MGSGPCRAGLGQASGPCHFPSPPLAPSPLPQCPALTQEGRQLRFSRVPSPACVVLWLQRGSACPPSSLYLRGASPHVPPRGRRPEGPRLGLASLSHCTPSPCTPPVRAVGEGRGARCGLPVLLGSAWPRGLSSQHVDCGHSRASGPLRTVPARGPPPRAWALPPRGVPSLCSCSLYPTPSLPSVAPLAIRTVVLSSPSVTPEHAQGGMVWGILWAGCQQLDLSPPRL